MVKADILKRIICFIRGHKYTVLREWGYGRKLDCKRCRRMFGMNDDARAVVPWDSELEQLMVDHHGDK